MSIRNAVTAHNQIKTRLLERFPDLADDEQALLDTLEGESTLDRAAVAVFESALDDEGRASVIADRLDALAERRSRFQARAKAKRGVIASAMEDAGVKKIEAPEVTLSLRQTPAAVVITDEDAIPAAYVKTEIVKKLDKAALRDALNNGPVPGATLSNGGFSLTARTK